MRDINFFSPYIETRKKKISNWRRIIVYTILITIVIGSFYTITKFTIDDLQKQIIAKKKIIESEVVISKINEINKINEELNIAVTVYRNIQSVNYVLKNMDFIDLNLLNTLNVNTFNRISLISTSLDSENVYIDGFAIDKKDIANYEGNLRKSNTLTNLHVSKIFQMSEPVVINEIVYYYEFSMTSLIVGDENEAK